ncbi:Adhesin/hemagglutinin, HecA family protein [Pseudomonas syringae pv. coriandricola]|nr:Adhesin/hemagglutinin, HecA family protein [Pseudomonas syringae pv. coriandricola]
MSQGFDLAAAAGNKNLGDFADYMDLDPGSAEKIFLHAMLGGAFSAARGGDFKTGAIAAGAAEGLTGIANENLGKYLDSRFVTDDQFRVATAQIVGIAAGSLVNGDPDDAAWVAGNVERYNAQLHKPQTTALEKLRTLNPELSDRLNDAACALSQCAASIPVDDPRYGNFKERQDRGEGYKTEIAMLQATGEFGGRSWTDRSDDFLNSHGNVVQAADASVDTASGIVGGVGSYAGMMATSPVCVGVLTCALPAGLGVLGTQQLVGAWDSASQINAGFTSDQPGRVQAAFQLETFPGESSITKDLAANAGKSVLEMSAFGLAAKYFNGLSAADEVVFPWGGERIVGAKGPVSAGTGTTAGSDVASTTPKAGVFWNKTTVLDRTVYQRNDLFDPEALSTWRVRGKTVQGSNLERMASGRAPIGYDGKSVELHHLSQTEVNGFAGTRGSLAEVGSVFHSQNSSVLHVPSNAAQSFRYTRYKDSAEYRNPTTDYVSVPADLNAKTLTKQAKEFNSYQSDYWKLRARSGE